MVHLSHLYMTTGKTIPLTVWTYVGKDWWQEKRMLEDEMVGWRGSPTQWTWVWASSRIWWWAGKPGFTLSRNLKFVCWVSERHSFGSAKTVLFTHSTNRNSKFHVEQIAIKVGIYILFLEKEMATHSSVLAWRIPGTGEPGRLPSLGLHRVGHDWSDLAAAAATYCFILIDVVLY